MARPVHPPTDPAADAAALLRRIGFGTLLLAVPMASLVARRALVVLVPIAIALLVIAALLDGESRRLDRSASVFKSAVAAAAALLLGWAALSLVWTPFPAIASERLANVAATLAMAIAGYFALPERMRSANLYLLPVGVLGAAVVGIVLGIVDLQGLREPAEAHQTLERGLVTLVMLVWPAIAWLRSRERDLEALALATATFGACLVALQPMPFVGFVAGGLVYILTASNAARGVRWLAVACAAVIVAAPALPFLLWPLAGLLDPEGAGIARSLAIWRTLIVDEPIRVITGHGFETALRGRFVGLLPTDSPNTLPFEIWYELGLVGACAGAFALFRAIIAAGRGHPALLPGTMAAFGSAFTFACFGIGSTQIWWSTTLAVTVLVFVAAERGQFRTTRPKAILLRLGSR